MEKPVIIFGAGGLGKAAYEIFHSHQITIYCFLDDDKSLHGKEINEIPVLGKTSDEGLLKYIGQKCEAFIATDENAERKSLVKMLKEKRKVMPVNAIHDNASLSRSVEISHGNFINNAAVIGANVRIGNHTIIHSGAVIEHEAVIGDFAQVGSGAIIGSGARIAEEVFIGAGAIIVAGLKIEKGARIGTGSVVVGDVKKGETVFGNPAKNINI